MSLSHNSSNKAGRAFSTPDEVDTSCTSSQKTGFFTRLLDYVWPIETFELPKFLFLTLLMFCILGIQNLIRAMKDSVINTMIATETISFLKFWGVLPSAILIAMLYVKLVSIMKGEKIFYLIMSSFLAFFVIFAFILFPNYEYLHLDPAVANNLVDAHPHFKWFILLLSNWSFSLFYIIAELWPNAIFGLLFWQFVNKITTIDESKRFYPIFGLLGQTGLVLSGQFLSYLPDIDLFISNLFGLEMNHDVLSLQLVVCVTTILGCIALWAFWIINHRVLDIATAENMQFQVKKKHMTLLESIKMVVNSRYIRLIAILLISYGIAINLVEGPWKAQARKIYPNLTDFAAFTGSYLTKTGILTIILVVVCSNLVRKVGWFSAAIITPVILFLTGMLFFTVSNFDYIATIMLFVFMMHDPAFLAITVGAIQNAVSKASKYTLFDSTKEMSYVPLDTDLKTKGKAAADMVGTKLGKSASAFIQSMIFVIMPSATFESISVYLMYIFIAICMIWIWCVFALNKEYKQVCQAHKGKEMVI